MAEGSGGGDEGPGQSAASEAAKALEEAMRSKDRAAELFKEKKLEEAKDMWHQAMREMPKGQGSNLIRLELSLHLNLAMVYLQLKDWEESVAHASEVIALEPENSKALFRRGCAYGGAGRLQAACRDLLQAARIEPQNRDIRIKYEEFKKKATQQEEDEEPPPPIHKLEALPRAFLDIEIGDAEPQRMVFALYTDTAPKTADNFRQLCTGEHQGYTVRGRPFTYKGSVLHRMIPGLMVQGGDFENSNGTGGESIYGRRFQDETFADKHTRRGLLAMANDGPNTNGSNFFVSLDAAPHLDRKHVIFGELVDGWDLLKELESLPIDAECRPLTDCKIVNCGELKGS